MIIVVLSSALIVIILCLWMLTPMIRCPRCQSELALPDETPGWHTCCRCGHQWDEWNRK